MPCEKNILQRVLLYFFFFVHHFFTFLCVLQVGGFRSFSVNMIGCRIFQSGYSKSAWGICPTLEWLNFVSWMYLQKQGTNHLIHYSCMQFCNLWTKMYRLLFILSQAHFIVFHSVFFSLLAVNMRESDFNLLIFYLIE